MENIEFRLVRKRTGNTDTFCLIYEYWLQWRFVIERAANGEPKIATNWVTADIIDYEDLEKENEK